MGATAAALVGGLAATAKASGRRSQSQKAIFTSTGAVRRYMAAGVRMSDGRILLTGGYSQPIKEGRAPNPLSSAVIYDPRNDTWTDAAPMKVPRARHAAVALSDGRVVVTGGYGMSPLSSVEVYDPRSNAWTTSREMSQPRYDHCAAIEADVIYLLGGSSQSMLSSVEALAITV